MKKLIGMRLEEEVINKLKEIQKQNNLKTIDNTIYYLLQQLETQELTPTENKEPIPCPYFAPSPKPNLVECGRLLSKKGKTITLGYEACKACHERRSFIQIKKEEQAIDEFSQAYGKNTYLQKLSQSNQKGKIYTGNIESFGRPKWRWISMSNEMKKS